MMQDFDRTLELVDISTNSYGATMAQHTEYMGSMQAATDKLKTSYEGLITNLANSDFIIGLVNVVSSLVDAGAWIADQLWLMIPIVILLASWGAQILNNKILEYQYSQAQHKLEALNTLEKNKQRAAQIQELKISLKQKKQDLIALKNALRENEIQEDTTEAVLQALKARAKENGDVAEVARLEQTINELNKDDVEQLGLKATVDQELKKTNAEINSLKAEEVLLNTQIAATEATNNGFVQGFVGILSGIPALLTTILGISKFITAVKAMELTLQESSNAAQKKGIVYAVARWNQERKNAREQGKGMFASIVSAFGQLGPWGVAAGIALGVALLAVLGLGIGAVVSAVVPDKEEDTDSIEGNIAAMQKLQGEIYNLANTAKQVGSLEDEFESLSAKINKTAEDTARLKEIIDEFNDTAGYDIVDSSMGYDEVLNKMRAYEASVNADLYNKIQESNETLAKATETASDLEDYMSDSEGRAVIQQNLAQNYAAFGAASDTTKSLVLDAIAANASTFLGEDGGLNYDAIEKSFSAEELEDLDTAVLSGSLAEYKKALDELDATTRSYVASSDSLFNFVSQIDEKISDAVISSIDGMELTADQMAELSPVLKANQDNIEKWVQENNGQALSRGELLNKLYENRQSPKEAAKSLEDAKAELEKYAGTDEYEKFKKIQDKVEEAGSLEEADLGEKDKKIYEEGMNKLGALQGDIEAAEQAEQMANMTAQEWWNTYGNIPSLSELQDNIDKVNSSMDQFTKFANGELDAKEMDELLGTYPELVDYMADGVVTAGELNEARNEMFQDQLEELETSLDLIETKNDEILKETLEGTGLTWEAIKAMDAQAIEDLYNTGKITTEDQYKTVIAAWRDYQQTKIKAEDFAEAGGLTEAELEKIAESTGRKLAEAQYSAYKDELELYTSDDPEYEKLYGQSTETASKILSEAKREKEELEKQIKQKLGNYDFEVIDGNIYYKNESGLLQSLDSLEGATKQAFAQVATSMSDTLEAYSEAADKETEIAEEIANDYIEIRKQELEKEKEIIEERKEAYEEYFDEMDALEEEQERTQSKEDIIKQISALSGGINGVAKNKIKELQAELASIEEEEKEAMKEEARNALLEGLDEEAERLDEDINNLDDSVGKLTRVILANAAGNKFVYDEGSSDSLSKQLEDWLEKLGLKPFASGGLVDYTGFAAVHGSPLTPEAFLDADDTALLSTILDGLHLVIGEGVDKNTDTFNETNAQSIVVENINIKTDSLNNNQDFKNAGNVLAREFAKIIQERGLNVNVKK